MQEIKTTGQSRRTFIRNLSLTSAIMLSGKIRALSALEHRGLQTKVALRFAIASDFHYGQPNTPYDEMTARIIDQINHFHAEHPLRFCVLNGDLIHNEKHLMKQVKQKTDNLKMPYYVTRGNHDMVTGQEWKEVWQTPLNHDVLIGDTALILGDTSNEKGIYLSPDLTWLEQQLESHKKRKQVFLFLHIPQAKWTKNAIDTPDFFTLVRRYPNIRAVFHGHEHDQDGVRMDNQLPFLFDAHVGGNWGTDYKGFRVVELLEDGTLVTYMMDPSVKLAQLEYRV